MDLSSHNNSLPNLLNKMNRLRKKDQNKQDCCVLFCFFLKKNPFSFSNQQSKRKEKVEKSPRIYNHVSMGTLAENQVCNPKPWEI